MKLERVYLVKIRYIAYSWLLSIDTITNSPTIIYENNAAYVAQVKGGFINGDKIKHISSKIFYTHELQESRYVYFKQIRSTNNLTDLFTKSLSTSIFEKLVYGICMRRVNKM